MSGERLRAFAATRAFHPAAMALMFALTASGWGRVTADRSSFDYALGVLALLLAASFLVAWAANRNTLLRANLLAATVLYVFIAGSSYTAIGSVVSALNALAFATLAGGSWWLEKSNPRSRR